MPKNSLFDALPEEPKKPAGPVTCLGMTFENDEARRAHFTEELRKKLKDPEFRKIEGFPLGEDEDILNLSDPPYYTACPNPWIADFIAEWESQKPKQPKSYKYHREPFAADVSEGKNDPIYNAHSYHTKVPHKAIMRYILHYTEPGDIVFDGFCGTGMTGVAAQMCGDRKVVESLGYQVKPDGTILQEEVDGNDKSVWVPFSKLGARKAVLNDLSPAATFISYNYNTPVDVDAFEKEAQRILKEVEDECGWMYETLHTDGKTKGKINYTIWSDVFICPECAGEIVFWDAAVDKEEGRIRETISCGSCGAGHKKRGLERVWITSSDDQLGTVIKHAKQVPVLISYSIGRDTFEKTLTKADFNLIAQIEKTPLDNWCPTNMFPDGQNTRQPKSSHGISCVHQFYTKRNLVVLSSLWARISSCQPLWKSVFTGVTLGLSKQQRYRPKTTFPNMILAGTLYVGSLVREWNAIKWFEGKIGGIRRGRLQFQGVFENWSISNLSLDDAGSILPEESLDYIFIDPPFGANINYSELNFSWESWLNVWTNNAHEAIENAVQQKNVHDYRELMRGCFAAIFRALKPGRWMTVEFSNTKASIWNCIQTALTDAGFIISSTSLLDKQQKTQKAITTPTAVKQDIVISAYKPNGGFEERFVTESQSEEGVWDFVRTHLGYLPVTKRQDGLLQFIPERDPRILFDQMVAFYVRKDYPVPISSQEFQVGLAQRFIERDGMYFLADQVPEYDRKQMTSGKLKQGVMFVSDEESAIQWLRQYIKEKPQTYQEIHPHFIQETQRAWSKAEKLLELSDLLEMNFLCYDGKGAVPEQIHAYLSSNWKEMRNLNKDDPALIAKARDRWYVPDPSKAGDLEKLRERSLLKEFEEYRQSKKKLKVFRLEAVRAGFKKSWQDHDYATIISVTDKIPNNVLEEDPKLLMWYSNAKTRTGDE